jgi:hypothetical protein
MRVPGYSPQPMLRPDRTWTMTAVPPFAGAMTSSARNDSGRAPPLEGFRLAHCSGVLARSAGAIFW